MKDREGASVWIGLAHVIPTSRDVLEGEGAFVPAVGLADTEQAFFDIVCEAMRLHKFAVVELADVELLGERRKHYSVEPQMIFLASQLSPTKRVGFGAYEVY